jgi:ATP-binding cassette subfamily B protein
MSAVERFRLWRATMVRCWRTHRALTVGTALAILFDSLALVVVAVALKDIVAATLLRHSGAIVGAALAAAAGYTTNLVLAEVAFTLRAWLVQSVAFEHVAPELQRAVVGVEGIEHLEDSDLLDRLVMAVVNVWTVTDSAWAAVDSAAFVLRAGLVLALLSSINPALLALMPAALIPVLLGRRGRDAARKADLAAEEDIRLHRHLFSLATEAASGKELRVNRVGPEVIRRQNAAGERALRLRGGGAWRAAGYEALGWTLFTVVFIGGLTLVLRSDSAALADRLGDAMLTITVGLQLRSLIELAVTRTSESGSRGARLAAYHWLRRYLEDHAGPSALRTPPPTRLERGITFEDTCFGYGGSDRPAVEGVSVTLTAGSVVAIVGEYGSGKTTLVKLLSKMYAPTAGRILVDGVDLAEIDGGAWRSAISAAFQDFGRYNTTLADAVGIGDLAAAQDGSRIVQALEDAAADEMTAGLPQGLTTELGSRFGGAELSEGQWQKVALARASMRDAPLLFVLDEPTASLDAPSEQVIFERYMTRARAIAECSGGVTVIVSHRFSTVAGADLILVMDGGRLADSGTHEELMARGGSAYAELYRLQANAYAS